jgi:acyl dehydratase
MSTAPADWHVVARNLPEHARNRIHTDEGAREAGFPRALVAGVTTYAYLTHPLLVAWGADWLAHGGGEVRFRRPVFDGDMVTCRCTIDGAAGAADDGDCVLVEAVTAEPEQPRAVFRAVRHSAPWSPMRSGDDLPVTRVTLDGEWGADYGRRAGDPSTVCTDLGVVHPAVWPALANHVVHTEVARGSWIHTRSIVRHHALAPAGATAEIRARVVRRFESHGERAVLDVHVEVDGVLVASLEHEAIVALPR